MVMAPQETRPYINDYPEAARQVYRTAGEKLTEHIRQQGWTNQAAKRLVVQYLRSLIRGNGTPPKGLRNTAVRLVQETFYQTTLELRVGWWLLPGMRQDWYVTLVQGEQPLFATQGGGTARMVRGDLVWVQPPGWMADAEPGDGVPREWDFMPANEAARRFLAGS